MVMPHAGTLSSQRVRLSEARGQRSGSRTGILALQAEPSHQHTLERAMCYPSTPTRPRGPWGLWQGLPHQWSLSSHSSLSIGRSSYTQQLGEEAPGCLSSPIWGTICPALWRWGTRPAQTLDGNFQQGLSAAPSLWPTKPA